MKQEIDNNAMWAAFRQELALQGELHVIAAIDNALNNLGFTIKETSTIIPIPLEQGEHKKFRDSIQVGDKVTRNEDGVLVNLSQLKRVAKPVEPMIVGQEPLYDYTNANICQKDFAEQKPAEWHREDEQNLNACLGYIPDEFLRRWLIDIIHIKYHKTAWSEEDEKQLRSVLSSAKHVLTKANKDWLKSLKDRVQPQPKQE